MLNDDMLAMFRLGMAVERRFYAEDDAEVVFIDGHRIGQPIEITRKIDLDVKTTLIVAEGENGTRWGATEVDAPDGGEIVIIVRFAADE